LTAAGDYRWLSLQECGSLGVGLPASSRLLGRRWGWRCCSTPEPPIAPAHCGL